MGDRRRRWQDYEAALRLDPANENAVNGRRVMIAEISEIERPARAERYPESEPSFNCATARRQVEKVICADPQLGVLDRQISGVYLRRVLKSASGRSATHGAAPPAQREFLSETRNARFGRRGYDLEKIMSGCSVLNAMEG